MSRSAVDEEITCAEWEKLKFMSTLVERPNGCIRWPSKSDEAPVVSLNSKVYPVMRLLAHFRGRPIWHRHLTQTCRTQHCVNPDHYQVRIEKTRAKWAEDLDKVTLLYTEGHGLRKIATMLGVSHEQVRAILLAGHGKDYRRVLAEKVAFAKKTRKK
jgi:hypothetical protein